MPTVADLATREAEFYRSLRVPELREVPDEFYAAVVRQASRIVASEFYVARTKRSVARARRGIADALWPCALERHYDLEIQDFGPPEPTFDEDDTVTICWLVDVVAGPAGYVHLHALHAQAEAYRAATPYGQRVRWNHFHRVGMNGSIRSIAHGGLLAHVAPVTWALTPAGLELLALVFGEEQ